MSHNTETKEDGAPRPDELFRRNVLAELAAAAGVELDVEQTEWQDRALCKETDPESFFPDKGGSTREAKLICSGCEVKADCLEYAINNQERFGIWGGLSERERRKLKKGRGTGVPPAGRDVEVRIATMTASGDTAENIARTLGITPRTVGRIRSKLRDAAAAAATKAEAA